ncbi:MAG: hypothetical protein ACMVO3_04405 [Thalassobaculum sp.]
MSIGLISLPISEGRRPAPARDPVDRRRRPPLPAVFDADFPAVVLAVRVFLDAPPARPPAGFASGPALRPRGAFGELEEVRAIADSSLCQR